MILRADYGVCLSVCLSLKSCSQKLDLNSRILLLNLAFSFPSDPRSLTLTHPIRPTIPKTNPDTNSNPKTVFQTRINKAFQKIFLICLLHYTTPHCTALHYTTLHYITLHYTTLHYTTLHYTTLHYTTLHYMTLYYTILHYTTLHTDPASTRDLKAMKASCALERGRGRGSEVRTWG